MGLGVEEKAHSCSQIGPKWKKGGAKINLPNLVFPNLPNVTPPSLRQRDKGSGGERQNVFWNNLTTGNLWSRVVIMFF